ncbi:MAG TPA: hypothetical protein VMW16_09340 [Sedimentisphaerales bacterium]|nr:hypothetical protein [Sedimentisphaerales bacterium]
MNDIDSRDFDTKDFGSEELDPLIIYGDASAITRNDDKPIPFDDSTGETSVSHAPLNLGGGAAEVSEFETTGQALEAAKRRPQKVISSPERITGVKTFYTKLHPGAMDFLDKQITSWLRENPGIIIKRTNTATGEVQGKKTEPNIIVTIWY